MRFLVVLMVALFFASTASALSDYCPREMQPGDFVLQSEESCPTKVAAEILPESEKLFCVVASPNLLSYFQRVVERADIIHVYPGCYKLDVESNVIEIAESY